MPDITKIISSGNYRNGSAVVSVSPVVTLDSTGAPVNHRIDAKISQENIVSMTGIYDARFDDIQYYQT